MLKMEQLAAGFEGGWGRRKVQLEPLETMSGRKSQNMLEMGAAKEGRGQEGGGGLKATPLMSPFSSGPDNWIR